MNWGSFGDITFHTTHSPGELQSTRQWRYTMHQLVSGYPAHDFHGENEHKINFKLELHQQFVTPWEAYLDFVAYANSGAAQTLMIGTEYIGEFAIQSLQQNLVQTDLDGNPVHISLQVTAIEVRSGD